MEVPPKTNYKQEINPRAADFYFCIGDCIRHDHLRYLLCPRSPRFALVEQRVPLTLLHSLPAHDRIFHEVNTDHPRGVYCGDIAPEHEGILPNGKVGYWVIKFGESGDVDHRMETASSPAQYGQINGRQTGGVRVMWYAYVDGEGGVGHIRRRALEKRVKEKLVWLLLFFPIYWNGEIKTEIASIRPDQLLLVYQASLMAIDEWIAAGEDRLDFARYNFSYKEYPLTLPVQQLQTQKLYAQLQLRYRSFRPLTVSVLGLGEIGQAIGRLMKTAGFHVVGFKRRIGSDEAQKLALSADRVSDDLLDVLSVADFVVNILPSTSATKGLLTLDKLQACKAKQPVFINVGRGDVIKETDLVAALDDGLFSKAVLDVFEKEPLPQESPLWTHPSVLLMPLSLPDEVADVFVKNLDLRLQEKPMLYPVDWTNGY